jgi:hypothetical protein
MNGDGVLCVGKGRKGIVCSLVLYKNQTKPWVFF